MGKIIFFAADGLIFVLLVMLLQEAGVLELQPYWAIFWCAIFGSAYSGFGDAIKRSIWP